MESKMKKKKLKILWIEGAMVSTGDEKLQPRDRAAMLGVNTIDVFLEEFTLR